MKNTGIMRVLPVLLAAFLLTFPAYAEELTDATVQSYEERLADIQAKKDQALDELDAIRNSSDDALAELWQYDEAIRYNAELKKLEEGQLDSIEQQIADAKAKIAELEGRIAAQEEAFGNRMAASYMEEEIDFIEMILSSESLTDFLTKFERVKAVLKHDRDVIAELEENRTLLEQERERLTAAEETQITRVAELEQIIADSMMLAEQKEVYIAQLEENEAAWMQVYTANAAAEEELNAELEAYLAEQQAKSQEVYVGDYSYDSILGWPIDPSAGYYISSEQGWRTLGGVTENHLGMDIACASGTNILAANSGTVLISEEHWSYGNYVLIDHGGGISTLYAHMADLLVQAGDTVSAGQLIGHCGLTGYTTGYHLHFEVRENGVVTNPRNYITLP